MLNTIRKRVASIFIKVLLLVLVLSFVLWGVSDVFSPGRGGDWLAKVGDRTISSAEYTRSYRQALQRLSRTFGQTVSDDQARAFGLPNTVLNQLITQTLLEVAAADMGLTASDDVIRKTIAADPNFRNNIDQFDAEIFRQLLAANGLSEQAYVSLLRQDIARDQLISAVSALPAVPEVMRDLAFRYENERRIAQYVLVPKVPLSEIDEPDDKVLHQFLDDRKAQFTTPELRAVSAIILSAEQDIVPTIQIPEKDLRAAYEERLDEFSEPERRSLQQMVFPDETTAQQALQRLSSGERFEVVAEDMLGSSPAALELTDVTADELPSELAEAAFALAPGQTSEPVETPLGWHILNVTSVSSGQQTSFESVEDRLRSEMARDLAVDLLIDRGNALDDILGSGATLEQAAGELGLKVQHYPAIDAQGRDASAALIDTLPEGFAAEAFKTEEGKQSLLTEASDDVFFVLRVDKITPPALKAFETVRNDIRAAWQVQRRNELTRTRAEKLAEEIMGGRTIAMVVKDSGLKLEETPPLRRDAPSEADVPPEFVAATFNAKGLGESFTAAGAEGYFVGSLKEVRRADPAADAQTLNTVRDNLKEAIRNDIAQQYLAALRRKYSVELNPSAVAQLM